MFLVDTIENILVNKRGDTEIIIICDGYWPDPPIKDHPDVILVHHSNPIGQRAATNEAAKISQAKFVMKCDAHCAFDEGFDVKLMKGCKYNWTVIPRMYNLHGFDWMCCKCNHKTYQGPEPILCVNCQNNTQHTMIKVWQPRLRTKTDFAYFDNMLHFQYWRAYKKRSEARGDIVDIMCSIGACWLMHRNRYWDLDGMDERHGSWGQMGVEIACKTWLSGGKQVVNKKTWFSHLFRTQPGFGFPYPNPGIEIARKHSQWLWKDGNWAKAIYPLSWLVNKFAPVPSWHE